MSKVILNDTEDVLTQICRQYMKWGQCPRFMNTEKIIERHLVSVNGQPVEDVFDYRYLMNEELVVLLVEKPDGEEWELEEMCIRDRR